MVFGVLSAVFVDYKEVDRARKEIQMEFSKVQHRDSCQEGSMAERRSCFKRRKENENTWTMLTAGQAKQGFLFNIRSRK